MRPTALIEVGTVRSVIQQVFPLAEAAQAHRLMESSQHIGKIMLAVGQSQRPA